MSTGRAARPARTTRRTASRSSTRRRTSAAPSARRCRSMEQGYVWPIYDSYDIFQVERRRHRTSRGSRTRRLRRGGHHRQGRPHRVHERARRRHGDLLDERRRLRRAAADEPAGSRRRAVLLADGSKIVFRGRHPQPGAELDDYFALLKKAIWRPTVARAVRDGSRRQQSAPGHEARRRELGAVLHARRQADHLRVELQEPARPRTSTSTSSTSTAPASSR